MFYPAIYISSLLNFTESDGTSSRSYYTSIRPTKIQPTANQEAFMVKKITVDFEKDTHSDEPRWAESTRSFQIIVDKIEFAQGKTKKAFKVRS